MTEPRPDASFGASGERWLPLLLPWSCLVLLPVGRAVEAPVLAMALGGLVLCVRHRRTLLSVPSVRTFALVFLAMWLPVVLSLPDAVNHERSALVALNHLRFAFAGVFTCWALAAPRARWRFLTLCGALMGFWLFDAWVQILFGVDLFGREPWLAGISAMYGASSSKFGTTFALTCTLLLALVARRRSMALLAAVVLACAYAVMSAGSRAAWVTLFVLVCVHAWGHRDWIRSLGPRVLAAVLVLAVLLPVLAYGLSPPFQRRVDQSLGELTGQVEVERSPLGHRGWIWRGALSMIAAHPVNGVGARGFRYAFPEHAAPGDPFLAMTPPELPTHSHHLLLELAAETGLLGLLGLAIAAVMLARAGLGTPPAVRGDLLPYAAALVAAVFPLNTHLAIYSAHWSQILWWMAAAYCAHLARVPASPSAS